MAKVHTEQIIKFIHTLAAEQGACDWGPSGANFKFPWPLEGPHLQEAGFTKFNVGEFENMVAEKQSILDGWGVKYIPNHGPQDSWEPWHYPLLIMPTIDSYFPVKNKQTNKQTKKK